MTKSQTIYDKGQNMGLTGKKIHFPSKAAETKSDAVPLLFPVDLNKTHQQSR